jgi:hypothetical protein
LSLIALSALIVFAISSVVSLVGFSASNRVAVSGLHKREGEAILKRHDEAVKARIEHAAWLRRTSVDSELSKSERKQLLTEASEQIKALDNPELPKLAAEMVTPDGQAALFANLSGLKTEQIQLGFAIFTAVLAIFAMSIANFFAAVLWARGSANSSGSASSASSLDSSAGGNSSGNSSSSSERTSPEPAQKDKEKNVYQFPATSKASVENLDQGAGRTSLIQGQGSANQPNLSNFRLPLRTNSRWRANKSEALAELLRLICEKGCLPAQRPLCKRWNQPKSVVSEWLLDFEAKGYITRRRDGNCMSIYSEDFDASALHARGTA